MDQRSGFTSSIPEPRPPCYFWQAWGHNLACTDNLKRALKNPSPVHFTELIWLLAQTQTSTVWAAQPREPPPRIFNHIRCGKHVASHLVCFGFEKRAASRNLTKSRRLEHVLPADDVQPESRWPALPSPTCAQFSAHTTAIIERHAQTVNTRHMLKFEHD